ncbi:Crp/Fnr family transcriptional regulator [Asticcacaulis solisilvae]|uniref:Crp/Fnr family transcriptional regulator n=1 Tax=Asticcacaulis solisilvae TaxID=1217274 RepID=UPI003FD7D5C5
MTSPTQQQMRQNALLSVLRDEDKQRLQPHMLALDLPPHAVLTHAGQDVTDTWFPCGNALAAFCIAGVDGQGVDVAFVGREGAIGGIVSNGNVPAYATSVVRLGGPFLRIKTSALEQMKLESISLRHWFSRYADCLLAQVFQTSACNAVHTIRQRVAKMILAGLARNSEPEFRMTQDQLADMLGVGRTFISRVLGSLRRDGIIETGRGVMIIKDLQALRALSCTCTMVIEDHFDKVLHGIYPPPA